MVTLATVWLAQAAAAAEPAEPETITILGNTYSVVPDDELRALGFEFPDVAPDENAATLYLKAIEAYTPLDIRSPEASLRSAVLKDGWSDESGPLADYLETNQEAFTLVEQAAARTKCHFPVMVPLGESLDTVAVTEMAMSQLSQMRELARFVITEGKAREYEDRALDALDAYLLTLQMSNHLAQDSNLIGGLVALACGTMGMESVERCLVRHEIDADVLADVQQRVHGLSEGRPAIATVARNERAFSAKLASMFKSEKEQAQIRRDVRQFWDEMDKALELPLPEFIETGAGDEPIRKARARKFPPNIMSALGPALARVRTVYGRNELSWTVLDVEFALARYAAEHGMYPQTLDELKPLMLTDGIDPFSGKPLHYRLEADGGFTIWSVGDNLVDDGGPIGRRHDPTRGDADYVWNSRLIRGAD